MTTQLNRAMAQLVAAACKPLMPELQIPNAASPDTATDAAMLIVTYQGKTFNLFVEALLTGEDEQLASSLNQETEELSDASNKETDQAPATQLRAEDQQAAAERIAEAVNAEDQEGEDEEPSDEG